MIAWLWKQIAKFSITKFLSGFNLLDGEKLGKFLVVVIVSLACLFAVNKFFTPRNVSNTSVTGQNVTVQQCDPKAMDKLIAAAKAEGRNSALIKLWFIRLF